jgi:amino acid adenylation domain-containing protein
MKDELRRALAQRLAASRGLNQTGEKADLMPSLSIPTAATDAPLPLSHAQERMWFLHKLDPAASAYNVCVLWHFYGGLNCAALRKSAERLSARHSIFRTIYNSDDQGKAQQEVLPELFPDWSDVDLTSLMPQERLLELNRIAQQSSTEPFDLSRNSPLRLVLVTLSDLHHALVMVGQHIVWDGPSFGVFSQELADGYNLHLNGAPDSHPLPPIQYIDFADWHRKQWQEPSEKRAAELNFWRTQLSPLPEPVDFPVDFERGKGQDEAGDWCTHSLDAATTATLLQLTAEEHLTPFEVVISIIGLLMTRLARTSEITIGTIASLRNLPELNGVIGNFGNVVPLRLSISNQWSFRELIRHCATRCRAAFAHADMPFEYLLDDLNISRGATRNPLLDTMVTFLSHGMAAPKLDGLDVRWEKHFNGTSQIDLSFDALLQDGQLQLQATWRSSLYRKDTVPNHLRRLAQLLKECVAHPDALLAERNLILPAEYTQLKGWGVRPALLAEAANVVLWFENTVRRQPDAIAIHENRTRSSNQTALGDWAVLNDCGNCGLSFAELNARANRMARWLVAQGVGAEDRVAIALPRKPEWFIAMLATLKAGAAFVPIDPAYPADYINRVIDLAKPLLTFVNSVEELASSSHAIANNLGTATSFAAAESAVQQQEFSTSDLADSERRAPLSPEHPVYVVFTSGSTGKPKGVVVPHSALVNLLSSHRTDLYEQAYRRTGRRQLRIGHAWSLAFDAAWQPNLWLFEGHELHVFDVDVMQDPIALAREIILRRLDFIELTPGMLDEVLPWLQSGLTEPGGHHLPGHVPAILAFGGESVKHALWQRILKLENTTGFNLYGPTEACVDSMIALATANELPNIGRPVAGAEAYVLDTCLQLAPPGIAGELAVGGLGLARGYITRGDLTASQFIANPHGDEGSRLYRTGDRVRWLPGGTMEYIGRIDEQVKIRGFRVEPLEVEATVEKIAQRPCAVVARKSATGTMQLLCFVETGSDLYSDSDYGVALQPNNLEVTDSAVDIDSLLQSCASTLPAHLVPKHIIPIPRLPRLPNGKINRRALNMPEGLESAPGRTPRTPLEQQLCRLMAEVLGREDISIDDGFFESGGDSISVIKLVSLARRDGLTLTARQVFDTRCVARLAPLVETGSGSSSLTQHELKHDDSDTGIGIPTPLMTRYLSAGLPLNRFAQIVRLSVPVGIKTLELQELMNAVVERHSMLRSRLITRDNGLAYLEIPRADGAAELIVHSIQLVSEQINEFTHENLSNEDAQVSTLSSREIAKLLCDQLDPSRGKMLAAAHVHDTINGNEALWLAVNHLVIDMSSWHVLTGDLALARIDQEQNKPLNLPPVPTAWRSWSSAQKQEGLKIGTPSKPRGTLASAKQKSWALRAQRSQCPAADIARRLGIPLPILLPAITTLASLRAGLVSAAHDQTVYLAVERHGREPSVPNQDLSRTIGWFAKEVTLPLQVPKLLPISQQDYEGLSSELTKTLRLWCSAIAKLDQSIQDPNHIGQHASLPQDSWQLGFNFLGDFAALNHNQLWSPQPQMNLLVDACGDHWPLLHDLDVNVYYTVQQGNRILQFDALGPADTLDDFRLEKFFKEIEFIFDVLNELNSDARASGVISDQADLKNVTPLQFEILRHISDENDPWTTQMELSLVRTKDLAFTEASLKQSAENLLRRHQALSSGFLTESAATFVANDLQVDWQSIDLRNETEEQQAHRLADIRSAWYQHKFNLAQPPLLRFMAVRMGEDSWQLLVNCHHLLLDGWSVPRVLHELLGGALGRAAVEPELTWGDYLNRLQSQDGSAAWQYWNRALEGLDTPSLLRPHRKTRNPTVDLHDSLSQRHSDDLVVMAKKAGVSTAAIFQLAWAKTLKGELGHSDLVFGLFDTGRSAQLDGISSDRLSTLVGLVTQLIPLRINLDSTSGITSTLRELQTRQFEWQQQIPVRLDNLDASLRFGEFFDTLLVIENALEADRPYISDAGKNPVSLIKEQTWRDSIGQAVGLFVYPGKSVDLRLCYDPQAVTIKTAQLLTNTFKQHLQHLINQLDLELKTMPDLDSAHADHSVSPVSSGTVLSSPVSSNSDPYNFISDNSISDNSTSDNLVPAETTYE